MVTESNQARWTKIRSCFSLAAKNLPSTCPFNAEGVDLDRLVKFAAHKMKPRADTTRLESQIKFVCFDIDS